MTISTTIIITICACVLLFIALLLFTLSLAERLHDAEQTIALLQAQPSNEQLEKQINDMMDTLRKYVFHINSK